MPVELEERGRSRSRWGPADEKVSIPGIPTILPNCMTQEQVDAYVLTTRLEEISQKIRTNDVLPREERRSVSPEPIYGPGGVRLNSRELRYRAKLEEQRNELIDRGIQTIPGFRPPVDYKKLSRLADKVYIPIQDFPEINFMGLLIGPRGNSLKRMESISGAKISIRGKGSIRDGKVSTNPADEEDLHCIITADAEEKVDKAIQLINEIIEKATCTPDGQLEIKRTQLRELASLNGTLREEDMIMCTNCGEYGHRRFECTANRNITTTIVCKICGGVGHLASDCLLRNDPKALAESRKRNTIMEQEYSSLMTQYGTAKAPGDSSAPWASNEVAAPGTTAWNDQSSTQVVLSQYQPTGDYPAAAPGEFYGAPGTADPSLGYEQPVAPGTGYDASSYYGYQYQAPGTGQSWDVRPPGQ